jgi:hypothetical protein
MLLGLVRGSFPLKQMGLGVRCFAASCSLLGSMACCGFASCPPKSQYPDPSSALEGMRSQHECSRGLRGESVLDSFDESGRVRVKMLFTVQHPQNVRFDVLSPMGGTLATLTADARQFALLDQRQAVFYVGPARQCNVERFLRVPIPPAALVQLLSGEAPVLVHEPGAASIAWQGGAYVVVIRSKHQAEERIELEPVDSDRERPWHQQRLRVREVSVSQGGAELYRVELSEYRAVGSAAPLVDPDGLEADIPPSGPACRAEVPHHVRFTVPIAEQDVVFDHQRVEHNPPLVEGVFTQPAPDGVRLEPSTCQDAVGQTALDASR